jgi:hypothetical protein
LMLSRSCAKATGAEAWRRGERVDHVGLVVQES